MSSLRITKDELMGTPEHLHDRELSEELAYTRRNQLIEEGERRFAKEREEVRKRYGLALATLLDHEDYSKLAAKHSEIGAKQSELDREHSETVTAIARGIAAFNSNKLDSQAQSLIDGLPDDAAHGFEEMRSRAARLSDGVEAHTRALEMLRTQMAEIRSERSIDAMEIVGPAHSKAVAGIADACGVLLRALRDEEMIREILTRAGYDARLPGFQGIQGLTKLEARARKYVK